MKNFGNLIILAVLMFCVWVFVSAPVTEDAVAGKAISNDVQLYDGTVTLINGETHNFAIVGEVTTPYIKVCDRVNGTIYDSTLKKMVAKASSVWADSETLMVDETATWGGWLYVIPTLLDGSDLKNGWYDVLVYERAGATPASTDTLLTGSRACYIHNGIMVSFDNI